MELAIGIGAALKAGGTAIAGALTGGGVATGGVGLANILQGTATVLSVVSGIGAANAEGDALEAQARDAEAQKSLDNLQEVRDKTSLKAAVQQAVGEQTVAQAASGLDLSFGTAAQARADAVRQGDVALSTNSTSGRARAARLDLRAGELRRRAGQARSGGLFSALTKGVGGFASIAGRK